MSHCGDTGAMNNGSKRVFEENAICEHTATETKHKATEWLCFAQTGIPPVVSIAISTDA